MSLLERYRARECAHVDCHEARTPSSALCPRHLTAEKDTRPAWVRNMAANAKDFTGSVA